MTSSEFLIIVNAPPPRSRKAKLSVNLEFDEAAKVTLLPDLARMALLVVT